MANQAIINAAKAAYTPVQGENNTLAGFVQGVAAVAGGLAKRAEAVKLRGKQADELYLSSDNTVVQGIVVGIQDQVRSGAISQGEGKNKLADLNKSYNKDIPQIETMLKDIYKKGISKSVNSIDENYLLGLSLGELDNPITVNGKQMTTFYGVDPETNNLTLLAPNGDYVSPRELKAILTNTATIEDRNAGNEATRAFIKPTYVDGENSKFTAASNTFKNDMKSVFENKKKRNSYLLDNPQGFEITTFNNETRTIKFADFYLQNGLSEEQNKVFENELAKYPKETQEKAKVMIIKDLMETDNNLDTDIDMFLDKFINAKAPKPKGTVTINNMVTPSKFTMPGKLLKSESQDLAVISDVETSIDAVKANKELWSKNEPIQLMGGNVLLMPITDVLDDNDKQIPNLWRFTKNMKGQTKEDQKGNQITVTGANYSGLFDPNDISVDGMNKILKSVLTGVPSGLTFGSTVYNQYVNHINK